MSSHNLKWSRKMAADTAADWIATDPVFLDTETTGLGDDVEVCDVAVVDLDGDVVFETLVKPMRPISSTAEAIHHITNDMVQDAPTFDRVLPILVSVLKDRLVVIYNEQFDLRVMTQSAMAAAVPILDWSELLASACAMRVYAEFHGEWNEHYQSFRWQRLGSAANQCGLDIPDGMHRARVDADLCRRIVLHMASQAVDSQPNPKWQSMKIQFDLAHVIAQAAPQVFGGDERDLLYQWLSRNGDDPQVVSVEVDAVIGDALPDRVETARADDENEDAVF